MMIRIFKGVFEEGWNFFIIWFISVGIRFDGVLMMRDIVLGFGRVREMVDHVFWVDLVGKVIKTLVLRVRLVFLVFLLQQFR